MHKRLMTTIILLTFLVETAGIEHLSPAAKAKGSALRPMATQVSGKQAGIVKASSSGSSNPASGNPKSKGKKKIPKARRPPHRAELRHPKKPRKELEIPSLLSLLKVRPSGALSALIFVVVIVGTFRLSIYFFKNTLIIFGATAAAAGAFLWWCEMLGDVILFFPRLIKHNFNIRKVTKEMEDEKTRRIQARAARKAEEVLRKAQELLEAGKILKEVLEENPPLKFEDLSSYKKALMADVSAKLTNRQRELKAIKLEIKNARRRAREYFIQKRIEDEQARLAQQKKEEQTRLAQQKKDEEARLEQQRRDEEARRAREIEEERIRKEEEKARKERELREEQASQARKIKEEQERKAREHKEAVEDLAKKTAILTAIEQTLKQFKKDAKARIARLKSESMERLKKIDWTTFGNPDEYIKALEGAIAPEMKEDAEIKELFALLKSEGAKNINERNNRLLISCRRKLSMLNPDMLIEGEPMTAEEFSRRLTEIKKESAILPNIDKLIEPKNKQWEKFEAAEHRANALDGALIAELSTTKRREGLHNLRPAREFGTFINNLAPNQKQRWFRRLDLTLAQKYYEIAQEELESIRTGQYRGPIMKTEQVAIINAALKWLRERLEIYESAELKDMRDKLSKALYHIVKAAGEQTGGPAKAPSVSSFTGKVPDATGVVIEETMEEVLKRSRERAADTIETAEEIFKEDKGLNASCTLLVILHALDVSDKLFRDLDMKNPSKLRHDRLYKIVLKHIIELARIYDEAGKFLTEEDEALLKGFPKIVRYVYIIAKLPDGSAEAAGIIWKERAVEELTPLLAKGNIDSEQLQALYDKLTKELNMPAPKDLNSGGKPSNPLGDLKNDLGEKSSSAGAVIAAGILAGPAQKKTGPVSSKLRLDADSAINSAA